MWSCADGHQRVRSGAAHGNAFRRPATGRGYSPRHPFRRPRLILDEPTAALGVTQSGIVLRYIARQRGSRGSASIFITHNPHHAYMVGDHFMVLARGEVELDAPRSELSLDDLMFHMAGGAGLNALQHELHRVDARGPHGELTRFVVKPCQRLHWPH